MKRRRDKRARRTLLETPKVEEMLIWLHSPATSFLGQFPERVAGWLGQNVHSRFTVFRDERVDVHEMCDAVARVLGDTGDDHSGIAVADENDTGEVLMLQQRNHVANVRV